MFGNLLTTTHEGRRFLLNFLVCSDDNLVGQPDDLKRALEGTVRRLDELQNRGSTPTGHDLLKAFEASWAEVIQSSPRAMSPRHCDEAGPDLGTLARILDVDYLVLHHSYGLLDRSEILNRFPLLGHDEKFDPLLHHIIAGMNGNAQSIKVGAPIRGGLPCAFFASLTEVTDKLTQMGIPRSADAIRDVVATLHDADRDLYLYLLKVPAGAYLSDTTFRPTFAEAGINPYFRAKLPPGSTSDYGWTVNLREARAANSFSSGVREVVVFGLTMSTEVSWEPLGTLSESLPALDQTWLMGTFASNVDDELARASAKLTTYLVR